MGDEIKTDENMITILENIQRIHANTIKHGFYRPEDQNVLKHELTKLSAYSVENGRIHSFLEQLVRKFQETYKQLIEEHMRMNQITNQEMTAFNNLMLNLKTLNEPFHNMDYNVIKTKVDILLDALRKDESNARLLEKLAKDIEHEIQQVLKKV